MIKDASPLSSAIAGERSGQAN
jgi:hypothetical protein